MSFCVNFHPFPWGSSSRTNQSWNSTVTDGFCLGTGWTSLFFLGCWSRLGLNWLKRPGYRNGRRLLTVHLLRCRHSGNLTSCLRFEEGRKFREKRTSYFSRIREYKVQYDHSTSSCSCHLFNPCNLLQDFNLEMMGKCLCQSDIQMQPHSQQEYRILHHHLNYSHLETLNTTRANVQPHEQGWFHDYMVPQLHLESAHSQSRHLPKGGDPT